MKNTIAAGFLMLVFLFPACKEVDQKTITSDEAVVLVTEAATAYSIFASTQEEGTKAGLDLQLQGQTKSAEYTSEDYPIITVSPLDLTSWPKTITVDYGPENVTGLDMHQRRGKMIISADNFPSVSGAEWEITFDEFYHDDYMVEGVQTIKYNGLNASEHPVYKCTVSEGVITAPTEEVFHFEQQTQREWISGYDTHAALTGDEADFCDDLYKITGTHSGKSSDGYTYTMTTSSPLIVGVCCRWVQEGILNISLKDYELSCEIDYRPASDTSEDACNNVASITIFGVSSEITLLP